jgi:hypothetical protein
MENNLKNLAFEWMTEAPERRGNGLKFVKENIKSQKMHLTFLSGNAQVELNDKMKIIETKNTVNGCLAIITL